ncbi:MAG: hypothetical protein M1839_003098 [Geoglossum umbratile]|nr:MAG: hypothetical protein M1839_003098 [Geoglossum umbratile]
MTSRRVFSQLLVLRPFTRAHAGPPLGSTGSRTICTRALGVAPFHARNGPVQRVPQWIRHNSSSPSKPYTFKDVKALLLPSSKTHLIDVREPSEYAAGHIPTSKNLPIASQPEGLFLPPDDFLARFGWPRPPKDEEVVFYCKAGVRSAAAAKLALQAGWDRVGEYSGSWLDWEKRGGEKE